MNKQDLVGVDAGADVCLKLGDITLRFSRVRRFVRYDDGIDESDVEHSYMLALLAPELADMFYPELNPALVSEFCKVHDLLELHTLDESSYRVTEEQIKAKREKEKIAEEHVLPLLPPYTKSLLVRYIAQKEPEAIFVNKVDKLTPTIVKILGKGHGTAVLQELYNVSSVDVLKIDEDHMRKRQAGITGFTILDDIRALLGDRFIKQFEKEIIK